MGFPENRGYLRKTQGDTQQWKYQMQNEEGRKNIAGDGWEPENTQQSPGI